MYSENEVIEFVKEEDVKFIKLAFSDVFGKQKNVSITDNELERAFKFGVAIDASAIKGFGDEAKSDLFLHPDPSTLSILPWRPEHGRVVRMFCDITYPDGSPFECDSRLILKNAVNTAEKSGLTFSFGSELEFYLFKLDDKGNKTEELYDNAGYMDVAPEDKGENIRREICLTLEQMGIYPESSHHEEGAGQNEIDFKYSDPLTAADNAITFRQVVSSVAYRNGLYADFSPKPVASAPGNGFHINFSVKSKSGLVVMSNVIAGVLNRIEDCTVFMNNSENSYKRFGVNKAPKFIAWSKENRSELIRIPAAKGDYERAELRSPDPLANPYIAFALIIYSAIEGISGNEKLPAPADFNMYKADEEMLKNYKKLPETLTKAKQKAAASKFITSHLPNAIISAYTK
ncbi:MAG: glutamine synthetase family protein [Clostridia bacterium]|nr:glutamine synthetase family protein [Clostridia bacterium]